MSDEASTWLQYARENLQVAQMTLGVGLLNPCLQKRPASGREGPESNPHPPRHVTEADPWHPRPQPGFAEGRTGDEFGRG